MLLFFLRIAVVIGEVTTAAGGALVLAEAADPTAAALVLLLVDVQADGGGEIGAAGLVLLGGGAGEEGSVAGSKEADLPPSSGTTRGDGDGALEAGALDAGDFGEGGALSGSEVDDGLIARVLAQVLISAISTVFDAVATLSVRDAFFVGADEVGWSAGASSVVARGFNRGRSEGGKEGDKGNSDEAEEEKRGVHFVFSFLDWKKRKK